MANINLISARRAERVRLTKVARAMLVVALVVGGAGLGGVILLTSQIVMTKGGIVTEKQKLERLKPITDAIALAKAERALLKPKIDTLSEAERRTKRWFGIMEGLKHVVPPETWLTSLAVEGAADAPQTVRVNGITVNQTRVGETMYRLSQQQEFFKKVDLRFTTTLRIEGQENVEFELAAQMNQPELEKKEEPKDATKTK